MPNATIRRFVSESLVFAALIVTVWPAVAQAGPTARPTATPTSTPIPTPVPSTGSVVGWGNDYYGQVTPPNAVNGASGTATGIAAGWFHSCAIQAGTSEVVCWGQPPSSYDFGQATPPDAVNGVSGTATHHLGSRPYHSCAIQAGTGEVVCWGFYSHGQMTPPNAVNGVSGTATDIAAGQLVQLRDPGGHGQRRLLGAAPEFVRLRPGDAARRRQRR